MNKWGRRVILFLVFGLPVINGLITAPPILRLVFGACLLGIIALFLMAWVLYRVTGVRMSNPYDEFKQEMREQAAEHAKYEELQRRLRSRRRSQSYAWGYSYQGTQQAAPKPAPDPAWCKVLGLPKTASRDDIKAKYRQLAMKHHPDKGGDAATFNRIARAYQDALR